MLNVPQLDDLDYSRIFGRARGQIPTLAPEWTNQNDADPGITMLQTFSWLYDSLNYYLNATGDIHRLKYAKLLGICPKAVPARAVLALSGEGELEVPPGTRAAAQDTVFETEEGFFGRANRLTRLCAVRGTALRELTDIAGVDGGFAQAFSEKGADGGLLYFAFAQELPAAPRLYFTVEDIGRNPFGSDFSLAALAWEYRDDAGWHAAQVLNDETCGLLRSGFLSLRLAPGCTEEEAPQPGQQPEGFSDAAFSLRCRVVSGEYDSIPRIGRVLPCCVCAVQRTTWARTLIYADIKDRIVLRERVRPDDRIVVAVDEEGEGKYTEWYRHAPDASDRCAVTAGAQPWQREIHFSKRRFGALPAAGARAAVVILSAQAAPSALLGVTDGTAGQQLTFAAENIETLTLALVQRAPDGASRFTLWTRCEDLSAAGCDDRVFAFDESAQTVRFGDSLHGRVPEPGAEVWLAEVRTSRFGEGNVMAGQISRMEDEAPGLCEVNNPDAAFGGCARPGMEALEALVEEKLGAVSRAVTAQDYALLAKATPGLCIDSVAVIPGAEYRAPGAAALSPGAVVLAVKPRAAGTPLPQLSEAYAQAVAARMENCRLLSTEVRVVGPRYLGIAVYGRILLDKSAPARREDVEALLRREIETAADGAYGRRLDCGRLYAALELLAGVRGVANLSLEVLGTGGVRTGQGDILTEPDVLTWLREIHLEYA